jgi:hypothetical protein
MGLIPNVFIVFIHQNFYKDRSIQLESRKYQKMVEEKVGKVGKEGCVVRE